MKIGIVTTNYLPFVGGVETHCQQVSQELSKRHNVAIAAMHFAPSRLPRRMAVLHNNVLAPSAKHRRDGSVAVYSLSPDILARIRMLPMALRATPRIQRYFYHGINKLTHPFYAAAVGPKLVRHLDGCDVIHGMAHGDLGWIAEKAARKIGAAYVCTPFVHPRQWGDGPADVACYRRSDAVIGLVNTDCEYLATLGVRSEKLHEIGVSPDLPDKIDGESFRQRHCLGNARLVLYVGRLMKQKGAWAVLEAASIIWSKAPEVRFVFIGPGTAAEQAIFPRDEKRIMYLGKVDRQEKADALAAADIFCMPSASEILPTVYLEAWSLRKPVIAGPAHGLRELVEGNRSGYVAEQTAKEVAARLLRLLENPEECRSFGDAGHRLVTARYSIEAVTTRLESLYTRLTHG